MEGKKIGSFPIIILLIPLLVVSVLFYKLALGYYEARYTESAHGNNPSGVGVNRESIAALGYAQGNCTHCHEMHASIGGEEPAPVDGTHRWLLMKDFWTFCYGCHKGTGSLQSGGIPYFNYDYGRQFGGGTANFTNIKDAFTQATSSHDLRDIQSCIIGRWGYTNKDHPCTACHNPHYSQKNHPVTPNTMQGVNTAVRKPSQNDTKPRNLWGDELNEMMRDYASGYTYQAPLHADSGYEPKGGTTPDDRNGSYLPNFVGLCLSCHQNAVTSTEHGKLRAIDWSQTGPYPSHGKGHSTTENLKDPYSDTSLWPGWQNTNFVLSCTDCHEPHGSPNEWLLRTCVNGKDNILITQSGYWYEFCDACHDIGHKTSGDSCLSETSSCHRHWGHF